MQAGDELGIDLTVGIGADVEQEVGIVAGGADEPALEVGRTFVVAVADVESPGAVEGVGTFQRNILANECRIKSGGVAAGEIALEGLYVFAGARGLMMIRDD